MAHSAFYYCKTLLCGIPDVNRRTIYAYDTDTPVKVFNAEMKPWTLDMQRELERELKALNELAGTPKRSAGR